MHSKRIICRTLLSFGMVTSSGFSQSLVNLLPNDVDVSASLTTSKQVGTTVGAEAFVDVIATDTTFTSDNTYILKDTVYVTDGAKLTIEAGTKIYGASYENGAGTADNQLGSIVVVRGAQIEVLGTASEPVLMTTIDALEASRGNDIDNDSLTAVAPTAETVGRWGGLVVLGNAFVANWSDPDSTAGNGDEFNRFEKSIEGFAGANFDDSDNDGFSDIIEYGSGANSNATTLAANNAESSGIIQYLSIRHGGFALADGNEINGLTLGGVGSGTIIDHVEVVSNADDGVEFFGGTVNTSHMVVSFTQDDAFDIDQGHSGTHQFWFAIYDSTDGDHGGEWDGVDGFKADGLGNSSPVILNATFLDAGNSASTEGIKFDDFFDGFLVNNAISEFGSTFDHAGDGFGANIGIFNNVFGGASDSNSYDSSNSFNTPLGLTSVSALPDGLLDPRPTSSSVLLDSNGTAFDESVIPGAAVVDYRGAFSATDLWADGWTFLSEAGYFPAESGDIEIVSCAKVGGNFEITFNGEVGKTYQIVYSTTLTDDFVNVVSGQTSIPGGTGVSSSFLIPGAAAKIFFRVEEEVPAS